MAKQYLSKRYFVINKVTFFIFNLLKESGFSTNMDQISSTNLHYLSCQSILSIDCIFRVVGLGFGIKTGFM